MDATSSEWSDTLVLVHSLLESDTLVLGHSLGECKSIVTTSV